MELFEKLTRDALFLWTTIDPIGTLALFSALTVGFSRERQNKIALKAIIYSAIILTIAIVLGQVVLTYLGIQLISFQLSGGIILFLFGLQMIFKSSPQEEKLPGKEPDHEMAVFPLAVPSIASPGSLMAVIIVTDNNVYKISTQFFTWLMLVVILAFTYFLMRQSHRIMKIIGKNGSSILVRIMGMILAALSIEIIMNVLKIPEWIKETTAR